MGDSGKLGLRGWCCQILLPRGGKEEEGCREEEGKPNEDSTTKDFTAHPGGQGLLLSLLTLCF